MTAEVLKTPIVAAQPSAPPHPLLEFWSHFKANFGAVAGLVVIVVLVLLALFADFVAPHSPILTNNAAFLKPPFWQQGGSMAYPLGTDAIGRDILSRLIHGARLSLLIGIAVVTLSVVVGTILGLVAGFFRGVTEIAIMQDPARVSATRAAPQHWATSSPRPSPGASTCTCRNSAAHTGNGGVNVQPPADWRPATTCRTTGARHSPSTIATMVNGRAARIASSAGACAEKPGKARTKPPTLTSWGGRFLVVFWQLSAYLLGGPCVRVGRPARARAGGQGIAARRGSRRWPGRYWAAGCRRAGCRSRFR